MNNDNNNDRHNRKKSLDDDDGDKKSDDILRNNDADDNDGVQDDDGDVNNQSMTKQSGDDDLVNDRKSMSISAHCLKRKAECMSVPHHQSSQQQSSSSSSSSSSTNNPLPYWVAGASPAKYITMEELMAMATSLENMALVHEIAVNPEFKIEDEPSSAVEKAVKECMKQAYWDKLREDLAQKIPDYSHISLLIPDIKKMILDVLLPQNVSIRYKLENLLTDDIAEQLAGKNPPDIRRLFDNILDLLAEVCAPKRDETIENLRKCSDTVSILKGICEVLDAMKLDLANFCVEINRPMIQQHSAEYEKERFMELVEKTPQLKNSTTDWLMRHMHNDDNDSDEPSVSKRRFENLSNKEVNTIINNAYLSLLEWDSQHEFPATLKLDQNKLEALSEKYLQLIICVCSVLVTCNLAGKDITELKSFKDDLKRNLIIITNDIDENNMTERLEAIAVQCNRKVAECCEQMHSNWSEERRDELNAQIMNLINCDNPVRKLIRDRIRSFILSIICTPEVATKLRIPPGLSVVSNELNAVVARFYRIVDHNRLTFGTYYGELIKNVLCTNSR